MDSDQFDYIIAGGGSAGCVLANRLSADPFVTVCLIEAGPPDHHWVIKFPTGVGAAINHPALNWRYQSTPQQGLGARPFLIPRGRVLGGSSAINGMVYFRGHPGDFDDWGKLAPGWSYRDVLPYFKRAEDNTFYRSSPYHGVGGPMQVTNPPRANPLVHSFLDATRGMDLAQCPDFNGADPGGFGLRQATIRRGRRESMATAFLHPVLKRTNLTVLTDALVDKVIFEGIRAVGVELHVAGQKHRLRARREVVLAAGAYGSPAILLRSGVGERAALEALGIPVVHHLPAVGQGLRDHSSASIQMRSKNPTSYGVSLRAMPRNLWNVIEYVLARKGPIGGNVFEATGFVRTAGQARPDLQLVFMPAHRNANGFPLPLGHGYGILSIAARPRSVGQVSLASRDPAAAPLIDPDFLGHPDDIGVIRHGLKLARALLQAAAFDRYRGWEVLPGPDVQSDLQWDDYIRRTAVTVHHPGCTCRMGSDVHSVVDPALKVRGIEGLRVADASVFPTLIAGNTNAAVVMVADKAADLMLGVAPPAPLDVPHAA
jgi:choline dehydrogenase